ncbi:mannose-1-phosphate guanylyltransferase/mannose-6-phosphate isomerase [Burkholderia ubonensis]|uniref:mannose-1-phosphate guanylyltransferase n=1 Tax=Burkholderia ubonensis TaxID=101571 RepID=A0AB74DDJ1_9BURK|nr:mannose-1-phosphate guanylyltransferase/mannose-6-phosphate isomerase [Burkholderia ubonensis]PAJ77202.1 mannose-1-phosphate guanylyltransferase/mannose-6-phosphate isomerase [Burkholderia ubonensis]PAJ83530.1 mannose-1-phosphate guanylyltransferase/mannose-6-phosphate isomerase [Burkholderia ubonensis]PAJ90737.1 mannose-1-phosphate guanylyltransferase/mannose-6-phosphate isomerase [Burkholderia ubonensis]PAJ96792.1 mannose-1-phosphate guanylyltransferase/mannose-6-phosphate isomerase [Burkh
MNIIPVIICGGAGTRLWPVSREAFPKPLLRLADGQSLLQKTYLRAQRATAAREIVVVTNRETYFLTKDECANVREAGNRLGFVLEPEARNTAAAIGAAAELIRREHGPEAVMLVLPADHLIADQAAFDAAVQQAAAAAIDGQIVTFGIHPTSPETGYGYIEYDAAPSHDPASRKVTRFVEKPQLSVAEALVADGRHLWNAGMFCFTAQTILAELERHAPGVAAPVVHAVDTASRSASSDGDYALELTPAAFRETESISIDYAVMERSANVYVVPCDIGWSDIGSWLSISSLTAPDERGNRISGHAQLHDADNCFVQSEARMVGLVGVHDLIVVDTPDALLVASAQRAQDVKHIVAGLKQSNHSAYRLHRTVHRPWGTYTVLEEGERFKMKRIVVKPGASLSLQMHHHRSEHWVVVSGCADVVNGERVISLQPNESTYIPAGHKHRLINPGVLDLVLIEVQCGEYLGEDDIVRFEDVYGRTSSN